MIKINLLPVAEKVREQNIRRQMMIGGVLVLAAIVVMGLFWFGIYQEVSNLKDKVAGMESRLAKLKKEVGDVSRLQKEREALEKRKVTIENLSKNRLIMVKVLDKISALKPNALYLTSLVQESSDEPWKDFSVVLSGVATDNEVIAEFMRKLKEIHLFGDVDLDYTKAKSVKEEGGYQEFKMRINVLLFPKPPVEKGRANKEKG